MGIIVIDLVLLNLASLGESCFIDLVLLNLASLGESCFFHIICYFLL